MIRKIINPFSGKPGYRCFGCCPDNPIGLHLHFEEDGDTVQCRWDPSDLYQGFNGVLHGGIQSTLLDELGGWTIMVKIGTNGVTSKMEVKYRKPVQIEKGPLLLKAKIQKQDLRFATIEACIYDSEQLLCTEAHIDFYLFPEERARKELFFPGKEFFFDTEVKD
jgi:uncharacterized protein (TIGR00369 family)